LIDLVIYVLGLFDIILVDLFLSLFSIFACYQRDAELKITNTWIRPSKCNARNGNSAREPFSQLSQLPSSGVEWNKRGQLLMAGDVIYPAAIATQLGGSDCIRAQRTSFIMRMNVSDVCTLKWVWSPYT